MQNASREGLGSQVQAMGLGFAGVPVALPAGAVLPDGSGTRAVHRDAGDDQGDACQVTDGRDLAQDDQSGIVAVAGSLIRPAAGRRPNPDACSRPARTEEFGFSQRR